MSGLPPQPPVDIPDHLSHGSSYVHRWYGCRCKDCQSWRREYDQQYRADGGNRRGRPARERGWYVCLGWYGVTYEEHDYTRTGTCVRCDALKAVEDHWEQQWNATE